MQGIVPVTHIGPHITKYFNVIVQVKNRRPGIIEAVRDAVSLCQLTSVTIDIDTCKADDMVILKRRFTNDRKDVLILDGDPWPFIDNLVDLFDRGRIVLVCRARDVPDALVRRLDVLAAQQ